MTTWKSAFVLLTSIGTLAGCAPLSADEELGLAEAASTCGTTVGRYDLEPHFSTKSADLQAFWRRLSLPVALLETKPGWPYRTCTGFLVTDDIMITERTCFNAGLGSTASAWRAEFDYQHDRFGATRPSELFDIAAVLETSSSSLYYRVLRVAPRADGTLPGEIYGSLPLEATSSPAAPADVHIIQHPAGLRKQYAHGPITTIASSSTSFAHRVDTLETTILVGSSGAPVIQFSPLRVVGMHQAAGCVGVDPETGSNSAASARQLYNVSPILGRLVGVRARTKFETEVVPTARVTVSTATQECQRGVDWTAARLGCALDPVPGEVVTISCSEARSAYQTASIEIGAYGVEADPTCTTAWDPVVGANRTTCSASFTYDGTGVSARCYFAGGPSF